MKFKLPIICMILSMTKSSDLNPKRILESAQTCPSPYCAMCEESTCSLCYDSYLTEGKCVPVQTKIEFCQIYNDKFECTACKFGYSPSDGKCKKNSDSLCIYGLDEKEFCPTCIGLFVEPKCASKKCSIDNCLSCVIERGDELCYKCKPGYVIDGGYLSCRPVDSNQEGCWRELIFGCIVCNYGYYDNSDGEVTDCKVSQNSNESSILSSLDPLLEIYDSFSDDQDSNDKFCMIKDVCFILNVIFVLFFW